MLFESNGVMWHINISNPTHHVATIDVEFELAAMVLEFAHVAWVNQLPYNPANFSYSAYSSNATTGVGLTGVMSMGDQSWTSEQIRPAASLFAFVEESPTIKLSDRALPRALFHGLQIGGGDTRTIQVIFTVGHSVLEAAALAESAAGSANGFLGSWDAAHISWEKRWQAAFTPDDQFFTGTAPVLDLVDADIKGSDAAGVTRV